MAGRVVALVDMDCFYVQVEERERPDLRGKPAAVVQYNTWRGGGIIAVNYEARDFSVKRGMRGDQAREKCPDIQLVQVPVSRGKADLTKYRDAGKEVINVLAEFSGCIERASIDEAYVDLTSVVERQLAAAVEADSVISADALTSTWVVGQSGNPSEDDGDDRETGLKKWLSMLQKEKKEGEGRQGEEEEEEEDQEEERMISSSSQDNLRLAMGAVLCEEMRRAVLERTGFKCSAGIAHNKMLAKLSCGLHKPNQQTVLPQGEVPGLWDQMPVGKVRNLGGKLGDSLTERLGCVTMGDLARVSQGRLAALYDPKTAHWLYNLGRGLDSEAVTARQLPKSVGCGKNFLGRETLNTPEKVRRWTLSLAEELSERLEADKAANNRHANTLTVGVRLDGDERWCSLTRSCRLPSYAADRIARVALALFQHTNTAAAAVADTVWSPAIKHISLSAGKFEDMGSQGSGNIQEMFKNAQAKRRTDTASSLQMTQIPLSSSFSPSYSIPSSLSSSIFPPSTSIIPSSSSDSTAFPSSTSSPVPPSSVFLPPKTPFKTPSINSFFSTKLPCLPSSSSTTTTTASSSPSHTTTTITTSSSSSVSKRTTKEEGEHSISLLDTSDSKTNQSEPQEVMDSQSELQEGTERQPQPQEVFDSQSELQEGTERRPQPQEVFDSQSELEEGTDSQAQPQEVMDSQSQASISTNHFEATNEDSEKVSKGTSRLRANQGRISFPSQVSSRSEESERDERGQGRETNSFFRNFLLKKMMPMKDDDDDGVDDGVEVMSGGVNDGEKVHYGGDANLAVGDNGVDEGRDSDGENGGSGGDDNGDDSEDDITDLDILASLIDGDDDSGGDEGNRPAKEGEEDGGDGGGVGNRLVMTQNNDGDGGGDGDEMEGRKRNLEEEMEEEEEEEEKEENRRHTNKEEGKEEEGETEETKEKTEEDDKVEKDEEEEEENIGGSRSPELFSSWEVEKQVERMRKRRTRRRPMLEVIRESRTAESERNSSSSSISISREIHLWQAGSTNRKTDRENKPGQGERYGRESNEESGRESRLEQGERHDRETGERNRVLAQELFPDLDNIDTSLLPLLPRELREEVEQQLVIHSLRAGRGEGEVGQKARVAREAGRGEEEAEKVEEGRVRVVEGELGVKREGERQTWVEREEGRGGERETRLEGEAESGARIEKDRGRERRSEGVAGRVERYPETEARPKEEAGTATADPWPLTKDTASRTTNSTNKNGIMRYIQRSPKKPLPPSLAPPTPQSASTGDMVPCEECHKWVSAFELPEHLDYHVALRLQQELRRTGGGGGSTGPSRPSPAPPSTSRGGRKRGRPPRTHPSSVSGEKIRKLDLFFTR